MFLPSLPRLDVFTPTRIDYLANLTPTLPVFSIQLQLPQEIFHFIKQDFFKTLFFQLMSKTKITRLKPGDFIRLSDDLYAKMRDDSTIELYELIE